MQRLLFCIATLLIPMTFILKSAHANTIKSSDEFIIEAYGGSSTRGAMAIRENGKLRAILTKNNEIALINKMIADKYGDGIRVINKGANSSQAMDLLEPKYFYKKNKSWREEMKNSPAKIVLLNFATNDARHHHFKDIEKDYQISPDQYTKVMTQLITIAREEGKEVLLQEPHPICGRAEKWGVAPYVSKLDALAKAESVPLARQYQRILAMKDWQSLMSPDCIHPSEEMYRMKAEETFKVMESHFGPQLAAAGNMKNRDSAQTAQR